MSLTHRIFAQNVRDMRRLPAAAVEAAGKALLPAVLRHAARTVPLYRPMADRLAAAADGDPAAWAALPVLTRQDILGAGLDALADALPEGESALPPARSWTSLSTPIEGPLGLLADVADRAQWEAVAHAVWIDTAGRLVAILPDAAIPGRDLAEAFGPWSLDAPGGRANRWSDRFDPGTTLAWLANVGPSCLFADPASIERLVAAAQPGRLAVDAILVWRPARSPELAQACRAAFGARLIEVVASDLCGLVAYPCGRGDFAPALETILVEVLDESGQACEPGEAGRLVATALYAYVRPVIRHDLGLRVVREAPDLSAYPTARSRLGILR